MISAILTKTMNLCRQFGLDPKVMFQSTRGMPAYFRDYFLLKRQQRLSAIAFPFGRFYPCLSDRYGEAGNASSFYFLQDLVVARKVFHNRPAKHVDVGSRIDGFVAHLASFRDVEVFDIRPLKVEVSQIRFRQIDMMAPLSEPLKGYCDSVSCLHAMEHFGLGRYGDPINYEGYITGIRNLRDLLVSGGKLYFSVPIGELRIEFNAHRVFSLSYLISLLPEFTADSFSFIDDAGGLHEDVVLSPSKVASNYDCHFGCGILEMTKK